MSKFAVGDTVMVNPNHGKAHKDTVTRVGRKYVYVGQGWREDAYYKVSGEGKSDGYGSIGHIYTPEEWNDRNRRAELLDALKEHGVRFDWGRGDRISTDLLAALLAVFQAAE